MATAAVALSDAIECIQFSGIGMQPQPSAVGLIDSLLCFPSRSPAASRIRAKILYATSKQGLRRVLDGVHYEVQATDASEMGFDVIRERAQ
jgi:hypothetical protein